MSNETFNNINVDQLHAIANNAETFVCAELSDYDKDLITLHEQCRKGELPISTFQEIILQMCVRYETNSKAILANLFAC